MFTIPGVFAGIIGFVPVAMRTCLAVIFSPPTVTSLGPVKVA